jgi:glutamyl-tRNA synthetase
MLGELAAELDAAPEWSAAAIEAIVRAFAERTGRKLGQVAQPIRAALTGTTASPSLFEVMAALGKTEALGRVRDQAG